ncbi:MAG: FtsQ-type POTRA domain-containing protein [Candidatus Marinimicrobia bacterium]|nr:FtsQ-type POTRA domain-containing protein [Candidatus Neomarinimicrobiota bacterium]
MKKSKKRSNWLTQIKRGIIGLLSVGGLTCLITYALIWADKTDHFELSRIILTGQSYLDRNDVIKYADLPRYPILTKIDLTAIQTKLESHPYIKAARISRNFPQTLRIDIIERNPISYINHSPLYLVDTDGYILPAKNGTIEFDVPMLTGFNPADELYPIGEKCLSQKINEAVGLLNRIKTQFPSFYEDISEVIINPKDEYELYLLKKPTKIYLGSGDISRQLTILQEFVKSIRGVRSIYDYQYVDLRYWKQVVVKERV